MKLSTPMRVLYDRNQERFSRHNNNLMKSISSQQKRLVDLVAALEKVAVTPNPMETPEARNQRIAKQAERLKSQIEEADARMTELAQQAAIDIDNRLAGRVKLQPNEFAAEIRSVYRNMDAKQRAEMVSQAIAENDTATLGALLTAPKFLTGMNSDYAQQVRETMESKLAPELVEELGDLMELRSVAAHTVALANKSVKQGFDPELLKETEDKQKAYEEAMAELEKAESFTPEPESADADD